MNGNISLSIMSEENKLDFIDSLLDIKATKIIHKGDIIAVKRISQNNIWLYSIKFDENQYNETIEIFMKRLIKSIDIIKELKKKYIVTLTLYVRSEFAQVGICLEKSIIKMVSQLDLDLEIDVLSFGMVEDI